MNSVETYRDKLPRTSFSYDRFNWDKQRIIFFKNETRQTVIFIIFTIIWNFFSGERERQRTCNSDSTADLAELLRWVPLYLRFFSCPIKLNGKLFKNTSEFNSKVDISSDGFISSVTERYTCIVIFFIEKNLFMTYSLLFDILNIFYLYFKLNKLRSVVSYL